MTPFTFRICSAIASAYSFVNDRHALYASMLVANRQTHKPVLPVAAGFEDAFILGVDANNHDLFGLPP